MKNNQQGAVIYRRLISYALRYRRFIFLSLLGYALYATTQASFAELMKLLTNTLNKTPTPPDYWLRYFVPSGEINAQIILPVAAMLIFIIRGLGTFMGTYFIENLSQSVVHDLRTDLFNKISHLPAKDLDAESSGYMVSRITYNTQQVTAAVSRAIKVIFSEGLTVITLMVYLITLNWKLTLIFLVIAPVLALIVNSVSKVFRRYSHQIQNTAGDLTHVTTEAIQGYRIVRTYGGTEREIERFSASSANNVKQNLKLIFTKSVATPVLQFVVAVALGIIIYLILDPAISGNATAGDLLAYMTAAALLPKPIRQLSEINSELQKGIAAGQSIFEVLDRTEEQHSQAGETANYHTAIEAKGLSFSYNGTDPVLQDINLTIEEGKTVALVGSSGSGKSTVTNLILRLYEQWQGELTIDGKDIRSLSLSELRKNIALVNQNVVLFNDSIRNNIAYGELEGASEEAIITAAKRANAWDFISSQPQGLDTSVGENGQFLSGGQRQRLAIARALLKDAPILILDEATSALDNDSEQQIKTALSRASEGRTTLIIAHRLSTIEHADRIIVMDAGKIVESGTHDELLALNGFYKHLSTSHNH